MARNRIAAGAFGLALAMLAGPAAADPSAVYAGMVYDILLLRQCGLADEAAETGFRLAVHDLIGAGDTTPAAFAAARAAGEARYEVEIRDRGGGPADPHCRREAIAAAGRFRAVIDLE